MTQGSEQVQHCVRHPSVETNLRCSRCNELICPRCLVQTPVGARCPECARLKVNPAFAVSATTLARAAAGAVAAAAAAWAAYLFVAYWAGPLGIILWIFAPLAIGFAVAEVTYRAAGYRKHPRLQWVAGGAVVAGFLIAFLAARAVQPAGGLTASLLEALGRFALGIVIAAAMAVYRTRM